MRIERRWREAGASLTVARGIIGDELRARDIVGRLAAGRVSSNDVSRFRATFAPVLARELVVSPAPSWLPGGRGVALATSAPDAVFRLRTGRRTTIRTVEGTFTVEARDDTTALAALPYDLARLAIVRELGAERRADAYAAWTLRMQGSPRASSYASATDCPSSASSTSRRTRRSSRSSEPEAASWAASRRG